MSTIFQVNNTIILFVNDYIGFSDILQGQILKPILESRLCHVTDIL